jgi:hypothetical protein
VLRWPAPVGHRLGLKRLKQPQRRGDAARQQALQRAIWRQLARQRRLERRELLSALAGHRCQRCRSPMTRSTTRWSKSRRKSSEVGDRLFGVARARSRAARPPRLRCDLGGPGAGQRAGRRPLRADGHAPDRGGALRHGVLVPDRRLSVAQSRRLRGRRGARRMAAADHPPGDRGPSACDRRRAAPRARGFRARVPRPGERPSRDPLDRPRHRPGGRRHGRSRDPAAARAPRPPYELAALAPRRIGESLGATQASASGAAFDGVYDGEVSGGAARLRSGPSCSARATR